MRRYVALIALCVAFSGLLPTAPTPGPSDWTWDREDGWVSLVDNGEGDLPDCSTPERIAGNGWCLSPEIHPRYVNPAQWAALTGAPL